MTKDTSSNQDKVLNPDQIVQQAEAIVHGLMEFRKDEVVAILSAGIYIIASGENPPREILDHSCFELNPNLIRRPRGGSSIMGSDQEIRAYILGLDRYLTLDELRSELVAKFGKKRAPGRSTIGRFLQKIKIQSYDQETVTVK